MDKTKRRLENVFSSVAGVAMKFESENNDLEILMKELREKFHLDSTSKEEKYQILTLAPSSWTIQKTVEFFNTTNHYVKTARSIKKNKGVLGKPDRAVRQGIDPEAEKKVYEIYIDDRYSKMLPGKSDCVSVGKKEYRQKRLMYCRTNELYTKFCEEYPNLKVGISKFYTLKPKWCISVDASGGHSVCVCTTHQNAVLSCSAQNLCYKELMAQVVCDVGSRKCMVHRCDDCPGQSNLTTYLHEQLSHLNSNDLIIFKQWVSTDRADIKQIALSLPDYIDHLSKQSDDLTSHSYISKCQANYLRELKSTLPEGEIIVLADFAENFSFVVQDEVQGYHWNKSQCTLHPIVIYYKVRNANNDDELVLKSLPLCFVSDDLNHDAGFVYALQHELHKIISTEMPVPIKHIYYFSDNCGGQYKNFKIMINLTFHQQDFNRTATWVFFAASHGKSPCDGIGGTVKRCLTRQRA